MFTVAETNEILSFVLSVSRPPKRKGYDFTAEELYEGVATTLARHETPIRLPRSSFFRALKKLGVNKDGEWYGRRDALYLIRWFLREPDEFTTYESYAKVMYSQFYKD